MLARLVRQVGTQFLELSPAGKVATASGHLLLALAVAWLVHATGGSKLVYVHFMYVPVLLAGMAFGIAGGLIAGVAGGLLVGPFMPLDVATGQMQDWHNWTLRLFFFALIGSLVGVWSQLLRQQLLELNWLQEHHRDTGLLNFAGLVNRVERRMGDAAASGRRFAVSIIQLENFLEIQNTFGAAFGMRVLDQVVARAKRIVPQGSLVALVQPDRLATVVEVNEASQVTRDRIENAVKESYLVDGLPIHVEASVGVAYYPEHAQTPEDLLQKASIAMHWATLRKTGIALYDSAGDRTSRDNLILLGTLPQAIERGELHVWHQAKLRLASGEIAGTEALLRWRHPERGMVPPGLFMPQAEETTLINPITQAVIRAAFADAGGWRAEGRPLRVAVNLSVRNLRDRLLMEVLEQNAALNGLAPRDIELEITESAVMADPDTCIRLVTLLRERGYGVAIDDFGVGHSSLSYLQKLQPTALKIDQTFVRTLATDVNNQKIVRSILHLARSLGLETVAEGVEDANALALLRDWGCDYGQGYCIHRPAPARELPGRQPAPATVH